MMDTVVTSFGTYSVSLQSLSYPVRTPTRPSAYCLASTLSFLFLFSFFSFFSFCVSVLSLSLRLSTKQRQRQLYGRSACLSVSLPDRMLSHLNKMNWMADWTCYFELPSLSRVIRICQLHPSISSLL